MTCVSAQGVRESGVICTDSNLEADFTAVLRLFSTRVDL